MPFLSSKRWNFQRDLIQVLLCMISAQFQLATHLCVKFIPNVEGVVGSCDLTYVLAIP